MTATREVAFNLREFDMKQIGSNKIIVFIGKRGTGKSCLVVDYLYNNRDIPICTVISPTDEFNLTYKPHIPDVLIHDAYSPELVEKFLKRQMNITKNWKQHEQYKNVDPRGALIMDDCLADGSKWIHDPSIKWIFMNGRHANITFLITMQYVMGIPPDLRSNVDYIFICKEPKLSSRQKLYKEYAGIFPTFEMFSQVLMNVTNNYGCLVIDNNSISEKLEDQVFWYKAQMHKGFRMCYDKLWEHQDEMEKKKAQEGAGGGKNGDDSDDSEEMDPLRKYTGRQNRVNINVKKLNLSDF
jgi:hypothetical protein